MKKQPRNPRKLALRVETVRSLGQLALRNVAGGAHETQGGSPCPITAFSCPPQCPDSALC